MTRPAEAFARASAMAAAGEHDTRGADHAPQGARDAAQADPAFEVCGDAPRAPKRIRRRRARGWRMPLGAVSVTRPGPWGNPFVVGRDGTAEECTRMYAALLGGAICLTATAGIGEQRVARFHVLAHGHELRGRDLACWCSENAEWCHANVLLAVVNRPLMCEAAS